MPHLSHREMKMMTIYATGALNEALSVCLTSDM